MKNEGNSKNRLGYGICHLSIVPVRREPTSKSEQVTQLIFGETYRVNYESDDQKFVHITADFDQYQGWIEKSRSCLISQTFYGLAAADQQVFVNQVEGIITNIPYKVRASLGFHLPLLNQKALKWEHTDMIYDGKAFDAKTRSLIGEKSLFELAFTFLGTPYLWGGKTLVGIDCSGLTQQVFKFVGHRLPRDAYQQTEKGIEVPGLNNTKAGDLAFFERNEHIIHVGFVLTLDLINELDIELAKELNKQLQQIKNKLNDDGPRLDQPYRWILHAYDQVRIDILDEVGIYNLDEEIYTHKNKCFRRLITNE